MLMVASNKKINKAIRRWYFYKEIFLAALAIISVCLLVYESLANPSGEVKLKINNFDFAVAIIFLADFLISLIHSREKKHFLAHNWYMLLASIPLSYGWAEALRGLRVLGLFRLVRAGEHLNYAVSKR